MLVHILPGVIMFVITLVFVTLFFIPITVFKQKNELIRFYWIGVWMFLAMIAAFSGGAQTLWLFNYDAQIASTAMLSALTVCFVIFVMFAWFRLSFSAIKAAILFFVKKRKQA